MKQIRRNYWFWMFAEVASTQILISYSCTIFINQNHMFLVNIGKGHVTGEIWLRGLGKCLNKFTLKIHKIRKNPKLFRSNKGQYHAVHSTNNSPNWMTKTSMSFHSPCQLFLFLEILIVQKNGLKHGRFTYFFPNLHEFGEI